MKTQLEELVTARKGDAAKLEQVLKHAQQLQQGVTATSFSAEAKSQLQELLSIPEEAYHTITQRRILNGLAFDEMHRRFDDVDEAHYETFRWIFQDGSVLNQDASEKYLQWLSLGNDIFHIAGKLGSGKSTLMKYLYTHKRTETELRKWAGESESKLSLAIYNAKYFLA